MSEQVNEVECTLKCAQCGEKVVYLHRNCCGIRCYSLYHNIPYGTLAYEEARITFVNKLESALMSVKEEAGPINHKKLVGLINESGAIPETMKDPKQPANNYQHGGNHYKKMKIEVWDFIAANDIGFLAGNAIKYVARYKDKNGVEDLKKAIHFIEKLIEVEENDPKSPSPSN